MRALLDDAMIGDCYEDTRGARWVYRGRSGPDDDALFPHALYCLDTDFADSFTAEGWDAVLPQYRKYPLKWRIIGP